MKTVCRRLVCLLLNGILRSSLLCVLLYWLFIIFCLLKSSSYQIQHIQLTPKMLKLVTIVILIHLCPRKNYIPRQCTIEMSNPNASELNCVCLIMNISATESPNFIRKYYLLHELLISKYWRQNISVFIVALHTAVRHSGVQPKTPECLTAVHLLTHETPDFITPALWPANSPDLNPVGYQIWWKLQDRVYRSQIRDVDQLKSEAWSKSGKISIIDKAVSQWCPDLGACFRLRAHGGHFEQRL